MIQVPVIINDRVDVAIAVDADGAHIGQTDLPVAAARKLLGPSKILGVSCKTVEQALRAEADGADYIGSGAGPSVPWLCFHLERGKQGNLLAYFSGVDGSFIVI